MREELENKRRELFFRVLPDLNQGFEMGGVFLYHRVDGDIPVAEPTVDDDVREVFLFERVEQVFRGGVLRETG